MVHPIAFRDGRRCAQTTPERNDPVHDAILIEQLLGNGRPAKGLRH
jgi:hypothetical protein